MLSEVALAAKGASMVPLLLAAKGGFSDKLGFLVMLFLYGLVMLVVWINRREQAVQGSEILLPSGRRLEALSVSSGRWETVWERGLGELRWWHICGALFALISAGYGVGLVIFGMLYPGSKSVTSIAPYAFLNAVLVMLVLSLMMPSRRLQARSREDGDDPVAEAFSSFRRVIASRYASWTPGLAPVPGEDIEFRAGVRLVYKPVVPTINPADTPQISTGALFLTLLLSAMIAPLLSGMVVGGLVLLKVLGSHFFLPIFSFASGGLTLLFAVSSFFFLRAHAQPARRDTEGARFLFDFEDANLYISDAEGMTPYHFDHCSALLLSEGPALPEGFGQEVAESPEAPDEEDEEAALAEDAESPDEATENVEDTTIEPAEDADTTAATDVVTDDANAEEAEEDSDNNHDGDGVGEADAEEAEATEATASTTEAEGEESGEDTDDVEEADDEADADEADEPDDFTVTAPQARHSLQLHLYGEALPAEGLLLATFALGTEAELADTSLRFGATVAQSMGLPLFATPEYPE